MWLLMAGVYTCDGTQWEMRLRNHTRLHGKQFGLTAKYNQ